MLGFQRLMPVMAVCAFATGGAQAISMPPLREGLWERHWVRSSLPDHHKDDTTTQICRNHAEDQAAWDASRKIPGCSFVKEDLSGGTYTAEIRCVIGNVTLNESATTIYHDTSAHTQMHVRYAPALDGTTEEMQTMDFKYLGSCPADMKPGDMKLPDGSIRHK